MDHRENRGDRLQHRTGAPRPRHTAHLHSKADEGVQIAPNTRKPPGSPGEHTARHHLTPCDTPGGQAGGPGALRQAEDAAAGRDGEPRVGVVSSKRAQQKYRSKSCTERYLQPRTPPHSHRVQGTLSLAPRGSTPTPGWETPKPTRGARTRAGSAFHSPGGQQPRAPPGPPDRLIPRSVTSSPGRPGPRPPQPRAPGTAAGWTFRAASGSWPSVTPLGHI